jgi:hypothetical protein
MATHPLSDGSPVPSSAEPAADSAATTFTVRYHRGRMLTLAAICFIAWCFAQYLAERLSWPYKDLLIPVIAVGPCAAVLCAVVPFNQPYLTFDTANRTLRGPGGWWSARTHPRPGRTGASYAVRGAWIYETSARVERRLPLHRWWAHPADWATITALLTAREREAQLPPDWVRLATADPGGRISFGINRKLYLGAFVIGLVLTMSSCLGLPFLFRGPDFLRVMAFVPVAPMAIGLTALLINPVFTLEPWSGRVVVNSRLNTTNVFPQPKYDHLEYSGRLGNLYQVRADGKRRLLAAAWQMEPKAWRHFTDLLLERRQ